MTITIRPASIGTVSHATLRSEDLVPSFAAALAQCVQDNADAWCSDDGCQERDRYLELIERTDDVEELSDESVDYLLDDLFNALNRFAPPNTYFGAHEGDQSDFGFWPIQERDNVVDLKTADRIDGYDRDDLGESPDY